MKRLLCEYCACIFEVIDGRRERYCCPACRHTGPDWEKITKSATAPEWQR